MEIWNGDILVLANPGPPDKWPLKRTVKNRFQNLYKINIETASVSSSLLANELLPVFGSSGQHCCLQYNWLIGTELSIVLTLLVLCRRPQIVSIYSSHLKLQFLTILTFSLA